MYALDTLDFRILPMAFKRSAVEFGVFLGVEAGEGAGCFEGREQGFKKQVASRGEGWYNKRKGVKVWLKLLLP